MSNAPLIDATDLIRWFDQIGINDVPSVGGKNASLGEMYRELTPAGIRIPNGFATTVSAYRYFLAESGLDEEIRRILTSLDTKDIDNLRSHGREARHAILATPLPSRLTDAIVDAYSKLCAAPGEMGDVAVRSSATAEDLPDASFAGQQETYLNVRGPTQLLNACHQCYASLFTDRAISYRVDTGFDHSQVGLSIGVQRMVRSDVGASGVMFSIDTESGFRDAVLINGAYGLGETVVQGTVIPDEFCVFKTTLKTGHRPILKRSLGTKEFKMVYDLDGNKMTRNVPVSVGDRKRFSINDDDVIQLARWACLIEDHYSSRKGCECPMDMEWAKDGLSGELFIVQARPETVQSQRPHDMLEVYRLGKSEKPPLLSGSAVGQQIGQGPVRIVRDVTELSEFKNGEVLVTDKTDPDWEPVMKKAAAIVTNRGGRTCHAAIVSRELGLPGVVGAIDATKVLHDGQAVTVSCSEGDVGFVYDGVLEFDVERTSLSNLQRPETKVMMIVGNPEQAFRFSRIPNDGVGLARLEFIINNYIRVHPMALLRYEELEPSLRNELDEITAGYADRSQYFVEMLAEGVGTIAAAFYPKDVIVRMSDFKSNEYANLVGGRQFEPIEENPMIGFRGASRYYDPRYREAFGLECRAMKKVREEMGLSNVKLMIPFCRTAEEGRRVLQVMAEHGLRRGEQGLEVYVMCEIPSNVIDAEAFAEVFDGFSIGSNDLTQLTLGVDRDSEIVAHIFDERDPAVTKSIASAIQRVKASGRKIGICGQAPSDYPEFAEFLVKQGIDSVALNPDAVLKTTLKIWETEQSLLSCQHEAE